MKLGLLALAVCGGLSAQSLSPAECRALLLSHTEEDERDRAGRVLYERCSRDVLRDAKIASKLIQGVEMGTSPGGSVLMLGYIPDARPLLAKMPAASRLVKIHTWSAAVPFSVPATVALARLGDSGARERLQSIARDESLPTREFLVSAAADMADADLPVLLPYLSDQREVRTGVPSHAEPRRRLSDAALTALARRLKIRLPFSLSDARRYTDAEMAEATTRIKAALAGA